MTIKKVDFPIKHGGSFPLVMGQFTIEIVEFPIKNCDFPLVMGQFTIYSGFSH